MGKNKIRLVIDTCVFIPCGDKNKNIINSIEKFGKELPNLAKRINIVILLSTEILKEYKSIIRPKIRNCHPLPKFHASFVRNFDRIQLTLGKSKKCVERTIGKYTFHTIESSKIDKFDVSDFVNDPKDEKFLRLALAEASKGSVFLLSVDNASLLRLQTNSSLYKKFCKEFQNANNVKVILPEKLIDFFI